MSAENEFLSRVWYAAQRHGLTIPFPIQTVYHHKADALEGLNAVHEKLATVATLQAMPETELQELSVASALKRFARNELVLRKGDSSVPLYLIIEGEALLSTPDKRGVEREVARLAHGEYIGIMQVTMGRPSTINVRALTDLLLVAIFRATQPTECWIDPRVWRVILAKSPKHADRRSCMLKRDTRP